MRWSFEMLHASLLSLQIRGVAQASQLRDPNSEASQRYNYDWEAIFEASGWTPREYRRALEEHDV